MLDSLQDREGMLNSSGVGGTYGSSGGRGGMLDSSDGKGGMVEVSNGLESKLDSPTGSGGTSASSGRGG